MDNVFYDWQNLLSGPYQHRPLFIRSSNRQNGFPGSNSFISRPYNLPKPNTSIPRNRYWTVPRFLIWLGYMCLKILEGSKVPKKEGAEAADVDIKAKKLFSYIRSSFIHRSTLFHYRHGRRWN